MTDAASDDSPPTDAGAAPGPGAWRLSREPATGWVMLILIVTAGGWLVAEIYRTIGLGEPRLWQLLRDDRVFDLAMLDFFLTAGWAALVLVERAGKRRLLLALTMPVFLVVPSLGIALFLLFDRRAPGRDAH